MVHVDYLRYSGKCHRGDGRGRLPCFVKNFLIVTLNTQKVLMIFDDQEAFQDVYNWQQTCRDDSPPPRQDDVVKFGRRNGRWTFRHANYCKSADVASWLFDIETPVTEQEIEYIEHIVEVLASIIDDSEIDDTRRRRQLDFFHEQRRLASIKESLQANQRQVEEWRERYNQDQFLNEDDYIYLMRHVNGLTKIGASRKPKAREKTLQAEDPRLEMFYVAKADRWLEGRLHRVFDELRVRGEWFRLDDHHIDWIKFFCGKNLVGTLVET